MIDTTHTQSEIQMKNLGKSQARGFMPVIPPLGKLKQKTAMNSKLAWATHKIQYIAYNHLCK